MEEFKNKIIDYLMKHGKAKWGDLLALGIPKASLSRVLKSLLSSGMVKKEDKFYVLTEKAFVALVPDYALQICFLIECEDRDTLTADLMKFGNVIELIENARTRFIENYMKTIKFLDPTGLISGMFKELYSHRGFFAIFMTELSKASKGIETILRCDKFDFSICPRLRNMIEAIDFSKYMGIDRKVLEEASKLDEVLKNHNYNGFITLNLMGTKMKLNIEQFLLMAISQMPFNPNIIKAYSFIFQLAFNYHRTGCRPLGDKEIEELKNICVSIP